MVVSKIFIVGAGFMGSGIAQCAMTAGYEVTLLDVSLSFAEKGKKSIEASLAKRVEKEKMSEEEKNAVLARLTLTDSYEAVADSDLVIEAVSENLEMKKEVFRNISKYCKDDVILASNTSTISILEIATVVKHPENFVGTHFFGPVPAMKLLELTKTLVTSAEALETAKAVGEKMGKICIVAKDGPGFIFNRMFNPFMNTAVFVLEAGIGSIEDIDKALKFGANHPMGPFEIIDMSGLDVLLGGMESMYQESGDLNHRPTPLLKNMVRAGFLGRKAGKGFYIYHEDGTKTPNPDISKFMI